MAKEKIGADVLDKKPRTKQLKIEGDFWEFAKKLKAQKKEEQEETNCLNFQHLWEKNLQKSQCI